MPPGLGDTIFAVSSGAAPSAIAVVRISGPAAAAVLTRLARRLPEPRRATVAALRDDDGALLDRALMLWFPGPATATGEDLAELHLHGGRAVIAAVTRTLAGIDTCRPAEPGEFTRRAFAHGRLDLLEAEGLADLLAAETEGERRRALHAAEGGISRMIDQWRAQLLGLSARAEALIEFGDDEDDVGPDRRLGDDLAAFAAELRDILALSPAERLRDGVRIVVAGPPNSGKSSLINSIAGREAAIATPFAGTTRDLIEVPVILGGHAVVLIDSAGLREIDEPIEQEGIRRARGAIESADIILWLGTPGERPAGDRAIIVQTMADLLDRPASEDVDITVSAHSGLGLDTLTRIILQRIEHMLPAPAAFTLLERQRALLHDCAAHVALAGGLDDGVLRAEEVRLALTKLDRLQGRAGVEDMLDALFGRFCIGK